MALTNLGALPTNFALASSCSTDLNHVYKIYTSSEFYLLQGPVEQTSCYPSSYAANSKQYYSPGQCPTGFTSACQSDTIVRCCPTQASFVCQSSFDHAWEQTLGCVVPQDPATTTVWTVSQVSSGRTALATYTGAVGGLNAYQIQVATSTSNTKTKTKTTTAKSQTHPTTTKSSSSSSSGGKTGHHGKSSSHGLSSGAIAGIVVGVIAGIGAVVTPLWLKLRNRGKQQDGGGGGGGGDNVEAETRGSDSAVHEIVHEKTANDKPVEPDTGDEQPRTNDQRRLSA
ncbi:hypothetical protein F5Y07DRAFT_13599 [Xylaria sp. FL0933]|nr:hypothetical protein F5Y07DRAFT_13599 [Xylaria sp. FL0933]